MEQRSAEEVDAHMKEWANNGFELVSASVANITHASELYLVHSFYWRTAE